MGGTLKCKHCGDVIGVYEPMIVITAGTTRRTSRAAEQDARAPVGECYHRACYALQHGEENVPE